MIRPLAERIVVKLSAADEVSKGGIVIPDSAQQQRQQGTAVAVGKDVKEIVAGDLVLFNKYSGAEVIVDEQTYYVVKEEDVLAVVEPKK